MNQVTAAAFAETALVTYRAMRGGQPGPGASSSAVKVKGSKTQSPYKAPLPSDYTAVVIVFGALHFIPNDRIGALLGWGFVLATFLNLWQPSSSNLTGLPAKKS